MITALKVDTKLLLLLGIHAKGIMAELKPNLNNHFVIYGVAKSGSNFSQQF
jgi:hypothetical protein